MSQHHPEDGQLEHEQLEHEHRHHTARTDDHSAGVEMPMSDVRYTSVDETPEAAQLDVSGSEGAELDAQLASGQAAPEDRV